VALGIEWNRIGFEARTGAILRLACCDPYRCMPPRSACNVKYLAHDNKIAWRLSLKSSRPAKSVAVFGPRVHAFGIAAQWPFF
jgi:hypothetical protein